MFASLRVTQLIGVLGIAAMFGMTGSASADISTTKHNLALAGTTTGMTFDAETLGGTEVCAYCHTPHNANVATGAGPQWNRVVTSTTFVVRAGDTLGAGSTTCLSCHDGTIALNDFGGAAWNTDNSSPTGDVFMSGASKFVADLTNQHPVGVDFVAGGDFQAPTNAVISAADTVECGSCHDPHGTVNDYFLRADNTSSGLCLDCHVK